MSFTKRNLMIGAIGIRILRKIKHFREIPDIVMINKNIGFGGKTSYEKLGKLGINSIIDLRKETPNEKVTEESMKYKKIGILDGGIPTNTQQREIIDYIKNGLDCNDRIFIHCNLGRGRATLAVSLYLLSRGETFDSVLRLVKKRRFVYLNKLQLNYLKNFQ